MIRLESQRGRIHLRMTALFLGRDLCVTLSGGDQAHIGAVALSPAGGAQTPVLVLPGHREEEVAQNIATRLAAHQNATVCVACGIHLDGILLREIQDVLEMSQELTDQLCQQLEIQRL